MSGVPVNMNVNALYTFGGPPLSFIPFLLPSLLPFARHQTTTVLLVGMPCYWTTRRSSTTPAHCTSDKLLILAASSVLAVPSRTSLPLGTRSTSANALSPLGDHGPELN